MSHPQTFPPAAPVETFRSSPISKRLRVMLSPNSLPQNDSALASRSSQQSLPQDSGHSTHSNRATARRLWRRISSDRRAPRGTRYSSELSSRPRIRSEEHTSELQ